MSNTSNGFYQSKYPGDKIDELLGYADNMVKIEIPEIKEFQGLLNNNKLELKVVDSLPSVGEGEFIYLKQEESEGLLYRRLYIWNTSTNGWCEIVTSDIANLLSQKLKTLISKESNARKEADSKIESDLLSKLDFKEGNGNDIDTYLDDEPTLYKITTDGTTLFNPYYLIVMKCSYSMIPGVTVKTHVQYKIASHGIYRRYYMDGVSVESYWTGWEELSPGTDTTPTEGSKKFITSGGVYEACKLLDDTKTGKKVDGGGEIFNDYDNNIASGIHSHAEGSNTVAGQKGFLIDKTNSSSTDKKYKLSSVTGLSVNDVVSIYYGNDTSSLNAFKDFGKITAIDATNKTITVDTYKDYSTTYGYISIIDKPKIGDTVIGGAYTHAEGNNTTASGKYSHTEGNGSKTSGEASHAEGNDTTASGQYSHAEGSGTEAFNYATHAEGWGAIASGAQSHAEGYFTTASGDSSHAEGSNTTASGNSSHAEGDGTKASGYYSHAEGASTLASGDYSHAEGGETTASGNFSHSEGYSTTASVDYQHVQGKCNIIDTENKYAHIVGNGANSDHRANAHTLDWDGNAWFAGNITIGSNNDVLLTEKKANSLYGATVSVNVDPQTYICTFTLKNSNEEIISTSSIDLPLESMVVSGEYNAENKTVILTLKSGDNVEFSIADLVSGLVSQSDIVNSLDSTYTTKPLSAAQGKVLNDSKADKPNITNSTETTVSTEIANNTELIYAEVTSISVTFPASVGLDYTSSIIFTTPATLPENYSTFPSDVYFKGDECDGGIFIPNAATRYTMLFYYDGTKIIGLVSGIEVTA